MSDGGSAGWSGGVAQAGTRPGQRGAASAHAPSAALGCSAARGAPRPLAHRAAGGSSRLERRGGGGPHPLAAPASPAPGRRLGALPPPGAGPRVLDEVLAPPSVPRKELAATKEAVAACGYRVTVGAVAAQTGLSLPAAEVALRRLAFDARARLAVSDRGDVLYVFDPDFSRQLWLRETGGRLEGAWTAALAAGTRVARVTFGLALFASLAVAALAILAISSAHTEGGGRRGDDDEDGRRGRRARAGGRGAYAPSPYGHRRSSFGGLNLTFDLSDLIFLWDPFYQKRAAMYRDAFGLDGGSGGFGAGGKGARGGARARAPTPASALGAPPMSLVESVASFVWGDGDPNEGLEDARWARVGTLIRDRGGVVTADELAPLLDGAAAASGPAAERGGVDESAALPALLRFRGEPVVTDAGDILYDFPELRGTSGEARGGGAGGGSGTAGGGGGGGGALETLRKAFYVAGLGLGTGSSGRASGSAASGSQPRARRPSARSLARLRAASPPLILELEEGLTLASGPQRVTAALLGAANLCAVAALGGYLAHPSGRRALAAHGLSWIAPLLPALRLYAASYFAVPALRWVALRRRNARIAGRNAARLEAARRLASPGAATLRKLEAAAELAERARERGTHDRFEEPVEPLGLGGVEARGGREEEGVGRPEPPGHRPAADAAHVATPEADFDRRLAAAQQRRREVSDRRERDRDDERGGAPSVGGGGPWPWSR